MIQITPQMRIVVAVEPADFRKGIDGLARVCKEVLQHDPFGGRVFVFRNRPATALKVLVYDGQGFWLCHKRLSSGRFRWWPTHANGGGQNTGGPPVARSFLGRQSRSDASSAAVATGRPGRLTRCLGSVKRKSRRTALPVFTSRGYGAPSRETGLARGGRQRLLFCSCFRSSRVLPLTIIALMKQTKPTIVEMDMNKLEEVLRRVEAKELQAEDDKAIQGVGPILRPSDANGGRQEHELCRLRKMLFGAKTEKTAAVVGSTTDAQILSSPDGGYRDRSPSATVPRLVPRSQRMKSRRKTIPTSPRQGPRPQRGRRLHRRREDQVPHASLQAGRSLPEVRKGHGLRDAARACWCGWWARLRSGPRSIISRSCAAICAAWSSPPSSPDGVDAREKYDATVGKHDCPAEVWNRNAVPSPGGLQENLGIPLPASTQWDIVDAQAERAEPVFEDWFGKRPKATWCTTTTRRVKILELMGERTRQAALAEDLTREVPRRRSRPERTGMFTSGIVSTR